MTDTHTPPDFSTLDPCYLNGNNRKWHKVKPQWTKDTPLPLSQKDKLKNIQCGDWHSNSEFKKHIYVVCPCSNRSFKYAHLYHHNLGQKHQGWLTRQPVCPPAPTPPKPVLRHEWYDQESLRVLINDTRRLPETTYNTAKLERLRHIRDHKYYLCHCGSACKRKIKAHLHSDLHKAWVLHGRPSRVVLRVRGFNDLVTE